MLDYTSAVNLPDWGRLGLSPRREQPINLSHDSFRPLNSGGDQRFRPRTWLTVVEVLWILQMPSHQDACYNRQHPFAAFFHPPRVADSLFIRPHSLAIARLSPLTMILAETCFEGGASYSTPGRKLCVPKRDAILHATAYRAAQITLVDLRCPRNLLNRATAIKEIECL